MIPTHPIHHTASSPQHQHKVALVIGSVGIVGANLVRKLLDIHWKVIGISKRNPVGDEVINNEHFQHLTIDVLSNELGHVLSTVDWIKEVTVMFYAGYASAPSEEELDKINGAMFKNSLTATDSVCPRLKRVVLITGAKVYGMHLGVFKTPARETDPRHAGVNFYFTQEDFVTQFQKGKNWNYTIARPLDVIGFARGNVMNVGTTIIVYAVLCKHLGKKFQFPGTVKSYTALVESTDISQLENALVFLADVTNQSTANQVFNVGNVDYYRWSDLWVSIANKIGVEVAPPAEKRTSLAETLASPEFVSAWKQIVSTKHLQPADLSAITTGAYADWILGRDFTCVLDSWKLYHSGFHLRCNTEQAYAGLVDRLREQKIIP